MSQPRPQRILLLAPVLAVLAVLVLIGAGSLLLVAGARADLDLPPVSAPRLLATTLEAAGSDRPVSGTVRTSTALGLPELPDPAGGGTPLSMLLGDETYRVWRSEDGVRIAHLAQFEEQVVAVNDDEAWVWDSHTSTAVRFVPGMLDEPVPSRPRTDHPASLGDPLEVARIVLEAVTPYAEIDVAHAEEVAGRAAYTLELRPRSSATLIGRIEVAIDSQTRVPLRLRVFSSESTTGDPVIEVGFTAVEFEAIDPQLFEFDPPPGSTVESGEELVRNAERSARRAHARLQRADRLGRWPADGAPGVPVPADLRLFGEGFGLILAVRVGQVAEEASAVLPYSGPLGSAIVAHRGDHDWVLAGAVPRTALETAGARLP